MFVTLDTTGTQLRRLIVKSSAVGFELHELLIYETDFKAKIINYIGEVGKLYVMVDERIEITIKVLIFDEKMTNPCISHCVTEGFDINSDFEFVQAFAYAMSIPSGCLIVNDMRLVKFSGKKDNQDHILQNYYNFLPIEDDDQFLLPEQTKAGFKHRRLTLTFNYPETCRPKLVQV